jgi:prepilin-type N-terminal cleavage/methylation domain-containing protein
VSRTIFSARGFTLVEALVAIVILVVGVLGAASLTGALMQSNRDATDRTRALELLRHKVEHIQSQGYYEVVTGSDARAVGGVTFTRSWTVTPDSPIAGLRDVQVNVTWTDQDGGHTVRTRTLKGL